MGAGSKPKKKLQRREAAAFGDVGVLPIPQGIHWIIDGRFCAFWSADLQSILDVRDLFQRAVGPGVSVLRVWFARMGLDGHLGKEDTGNSGPRRLFAPSGLPFPFFLLLSSPFFHASISHTFSSKHYMYYVSHRCSRWISGSLGGED